MGKTLITQKTRQPVPLRQSQTGQTKNWQNQ